MKAVLNDLKYQYKFGGITQKLIFWNIGCFLVSYVFFGILGLFKIHFDFLSYVSLSSNGLELLEKPWSIISYSFFHTDVFHLFFNMLLLRFSGQLFLTFFTQKQLLGVYIIAALFSGLAFVVCFSLLNKNSVIVGSSAAIMALLVATTTYSPLMNVRLLLIGNVKLWHITVFTIVIADVLQIRDGNLGGHIAHLCGALLGFAYVKLLQNNIDLSKIIFVVSNFVVSLFQKSPSKPFKKVHRNYSVTETNTPSKIKIKDKNQQQIDEILDKISASGYDSLTQSEKEFLFKAGT